MTRSIYGSEPLDPGFNIAVLTIVGRLCPTGYDITPNQEEAPSTLEQLVAQVAETGRIKVWSGASDQTIYGVPEVNWAARAWHDWCHWHLRADFDIAGERRVATLQQEQLRSLYNGHERLDYWMTLIDIEVNEQVAHKEAFGEFPKDQRRFVLNQLQLRATMKGWKVAA